METPTSLRLGVVVLALGATACDSGEERGAAADPTVDPTGISGAEVDGDDEAPGADPEMREAINTYVQGLGHMKVEEAVPPTALECLPEDDLCGEVIEGELRCIYTRYTTTEQFDKFVAFQPNSATLWPGALVKGGDAREGILTPLPLALAPVTFSLSLENLGGSPVGEMAEPSLSAFREARNAVLAQGVTGATPADLYYDMEEVTTDAQLSIILGASVKWPGGSEISGMFDFGDKALTSRLLVNFTQSYYTIDVDTPLTPADFFDPAVALADIEAHTAVDDPPVYVQSITFGRRVIFSVETEESTEAITAALDAVFQGAASGKVELDVKSQEVLKNSKISALVLGGSGQAAAKAVFGFEGMVEYITSGGNYSADSPGAPLAYRLAYLDNAATRFAFTSEYSEKACEPLMP